MSALQVQQEQPPIGPDILGTFYSVPITNAFVMALLVSALLFIFFSHVRKHLKMIPSRTQAFVEMAVEAFLDLLDQITNSRKSSRELLPLIGTLFIFIGLSNFIGLIPGITAITYNGVPLFRTPTNDFNTTFSIALAMVVLSQFASIKRFGFFTHLGKYFQFVGIYKGFKKGIGAGFMSIIDFLMGLLDIISEFAKVISLSLRLFGNMYAGEVLAAVLMGVLAIALPAPWLAMNMLVALLQAMVFGALTAAYYTLAVGDAEESVT